MALFLDTSAVVKLFIPESGSDRVSRIMAGDSLRHIARITEHEFLSAVHLRVRTATLTRTAGDLAIKDFQTHFLIQISKVGLDEDVLSRAQSLLVRHGPAGLRVLDSIQLASCQSIPGAVFVLADKPLSEFATAEGISVELVE